MSCAAHSAQCFRTTALTRAACGQIAMSHFREHYNKREVHPVWGTFGASTLTMRSTLIVSDCRYIDSTQACTVTYVSTARKRCALSEGA